MQLMTSIAHRVEEDIQNLASRIGRAPPTSLITDPTGLAGSCSLPNFAAGVDIDLLKRLADESQSNTSEGEQDTSQAAAAEVACKGASPNSVLTVSGGMELQQRGATSRAATAAAEEMVEQGEDKLQHQQKRRRGEETSTSSGQLQQQQQEVQEESQHQQQQQLGGADQPVRKRLCAGPSQEQQVCSADQPQGLCRGKQFQRQCGEQGSNGTPEAADVFATAPAEEVVTGIAAAAVAEGARSEEAPEAAATVTVVTTRAETGAPMPHAAAGDAVAALGSALAQQEKQQQPCGSGSSSGRMMAPPPCCGRHGSILRQTQVALTTWAHLKTHASTPSTVIAHPSQAVSTPMACTESSTA